jgi:hypothetical protein
MNWQDNLLLEGASPDVALRGQYQLAMYALHLSAGHSILCQSIKVATIEQYLLAASSFVSLFNGIDVRKDRPTDTQMGVILAPVLHDLKKYESIPDRREPYDPQMHTAARLMAAQYHPNSLTCALTDGFEQGYCAGYRLSEWAQPAHGSPILLPHNSIISLTRPSALVRWCPMISGFLWFPAVGYPDWQSSKSRSTRLLRCGCAGAPRRWPARGRETIR